MASEVIMFPFAVGVMTMVHGFRTASPKYLAVGAVFTVLGFGLILWMFAQAY